MVKYCKNSLLLICLCACRIFVGKDPNANFFDSGQNGKGPSLAIIGDSLSTAVLASTSLGFGLSGQLQDRFNRIIFSGYFEMRLYQAQFSEYKLSAMTTDESWGFRAAIAKSKNMTPSDIPLFLLSKWGGRTDHFDEFLTEIDTSYKGKNPAPFVLVAIGGNDYCKAKSPDKFASDYSSFLRKVLDIHPNSTVLVSDIPPLPQLLRYDYSYSKYLSCRVFREKFCKTLFFADADSLFAKYNEVIRAEVEKVKKGYQGKILFTDKLGKMDLQREDISFDCFHPSKVGHRKFAEFFRDALATGS